MHEFVVSLLCTVYNLFAFDNGLSLFLSLSLSLYLSFFPSTFLQPTLLGSELLDMAASHMKVKEKDYFSLYVEGEGWVSCMYMYISSSRNE